MLITTYTVIPRHSKLLCIVVAQVELQHRGKIPEDVNDTEKWYRKQLELG
jgi:hypothetical protein